MTRLPPAVLLILSFFATLGARTVVRGEVSLPVTNGSDRALQLWVQKGNPPRWMKPPLEVRASAHPGAIPAR
jgi:hypothetical protein